LRASIFHFNPGYERDQDLYLDIGDFGPDRPDVWKSQDHYLDVILRAGRDAVLLDVDELLAAHAEGYLSLTQAQHAIETATEAIAGIAAHGYDFEAWLRSRGIDISWL
ncbi:MAG: DUF402 domain-containing protein, partial [Nocardia sp.]|nr:DUF402 domain-containing protein [Nocardia sp.]